MIKNRLMISAKSIQNFFSIALRKQFFAIFVPLAILSIQLVTLEKSPVFFEIVNKTGNAIEVNALYDRIDGKYYNFNIPSTTLKKNQKILFQDYVYKTLLFSPRKGGYMRVHIANDKSLKCEYYINRHQGKYRSRIEITINNSLTCNAA